MQSLLASIRLVVATMLDLRRRLRRRDLGRRPGRHAGHGAKAR